ncbi:MAG: hypothetical protein JW829_08205 [Pirellulales bacterium]|nr:hypothetical protein [Pirellulales bacterium]
MVPAPTRRVVLIGASNLTMGISTVVETAQRLLDEPLDIMVAMGHGRSYGAVSSVLGRKISGIFFAHLWDDLAHRPPLPTVALVTDIGNDVLYGKPVNRLLGWVEGCLDRLVEAHATTVITELPLASLRTLRPRRFHIVRSLFFSHSDLSLNEALARAEEVNAGVVQLGQNRKMTVFPGNSAWYGLDPIHIRYRDWSNAWPAILSNWKGPDPQPIRLQGSLRRWLYLQTRMPYERSIWRLQQRRDQPSGRFSNGTLISLY